jgi:ankyrin repeat/BTB/POZ domain-containing protein 1
MGDVERVRCLLDRFEVSINARDAWDSTPLYYACLCGHTELVKYLLQNGARLEEDKFEGERCFYAALTPALRNIVKDFKLRAPERGPLCEWLRQLLARQEATDITFIVGLDQTKVRAHRLVLAARCPYLLKMTEGKWRDCSVVHLRNKKIVGNAFRAFINFLYTARLEVPYELGRDCARVCKQCRLGDLHLKVIQVFLLCNYFVGTDHEKC